MNSNILFPITAEQFICISQQETGKDLGSTEREVCNILVLCLNDAYEDGRSGKGRYPLKYEDFREAAAKAGSFVDEQFGRSLCAWVNYAWECGRRS